MQDFERYRLIEQYLNDELSLSERIRFEERIAQDPALAEEVELYALSNKVVFENRLLEVKQKIQSSFPKNDNSSGWNRYIVPAIIGIGIIASMSGYLYYSKEHTSVTQKNKSEVQRSTIEQEHTIINNAAEEEKTTPSLHASNPATNSTATSTANQVNITSVVKTDSVHTSTGIVPQIKTQTNDPIPSSSKIDNTNKTTANPPKDKINPCTNVVLAAEFKVTPTCKDATTGEIQIFLSKTTGGKAPYSYAINNESFGMESYFNELKKGTYTIHIKDQNNCTQLFPKEIKEVTCIQPLDDYSFNPNRGQTWKYDNKSMAIAHIQILDKSGMLLKSYDVHPGQQVEWDGKSEQGNAVQMGGYVCLISYDNGVIEKGMIIIYQ